MTGTGGRGGGGGGGGGGGDRTGGARKFSDYGPFLLFFTRVKGITCCVSWARLFAEFKQTLGRTQIRRRVETLYFFFRTIKLQQQQQTC